MSKIISADRLGEVKSWEIPSVDSPTEVTVSTYSEGLASLGGQLPTVKDLEELKTQAYDESYQTGYEKGLADGKAKFAELVTIGQQMLEELVDPKQHIDQHMKEQLAKLSLAVARQIIKVEVSLNPEILLNFINEAIALLPSSPMKIFVHLNPMDVAGLKKILNKTDDLDWEIVEDESMGSGGCKVFNEISSVDLSLDSQLAKIASRFLGGDASSPGDDISELSI